MNITPETRYAIETVLKALFFVTPFIFTSYSIYIAVLICVAAVYRRQKTIEFSRIYLQKVLRNQYGTNLFFILTFLSGGSTTSLFFYVPLALHFLTGIAQYLHIIKQKPFVVKYLSKYTIIKDSKNQLLIAKARIEFIYLFVCIVFTLTNLGRIINTIFYLQYIGLRYKLSDLFRNTVWQLDALAEQKTRNIGILRNAHLMIRQLSQKIIGYLGR